MPSHFEKCVIPSIANLDKKKNVNRTTEILTIKSVEQIPALETIREIPRHKTLKLIFAPSIQRQRKEIGEMLKEELWGFKVGIHTSEPEINIAKLITDEEIENNQDFFENCAKDYRKLSTELIHKLADKLEVTINPKIPLLTFKPYMTDRGKCEPIDGWRYHFHGFHCRFENMETGQEIEVPLVFGLEFGDLDPYFFSLFIKSTPEYQPLPVAIYEDYADGAKINEKMLSLGKFEKIRSNFENHFGIAVADRDKVEIEVYKEEALKLKGIIFNYWMHTK